MLKRVFFVIFTAAVIACHAAPKPQPIVDGIANVMPDQQQQLVIKEVVNLIESYNYKKVQVNDSISSLILDKYIKALDQGKNYFLASDIAAFEKYRYTLDDDFKNGDLSGPFYIYNVYAKRLNEYFAYSLAQIKNKYDFNQNDTYVYDREKLPWAPSTAALNDTWKKRVKYELINLNLAGSAQDKNVTTLTKRYQNLKSQIAKNNNQDVFQILMDAFTESIDPHTNYFVPARATEFNEEMSRSFEGIGARLQLENEVVKIAEIIPGGPAFKGKQLTAGDRIIAVAQGNDDFVDIVGWRLDATVSKIKGPKGTKVRLKVIPVGKEMSSKPVIIEMMREKVILEDQSAKKKVKTVTTNGKNYKIGVISLPAFYADFKAANAGDKNYKSTTRDVRKLVDSLKNIDKVDAIVMDLRGNGGGSLVEAISLTGLFIDRGPVVQVKDLRGKIEVDEDENAGVAWNGPFGVIVDRLSASASEIFAGAIQDYGRGIIMGSQTYGKGTVQSSIDLNKLVNPGMLQKIAGLVTKDKTLGTSPTSTNASDINLGQINLTMAKFYRVAGSSTQHKGVLPDVIFPSLYPMDKIGEDTEPSALPWDVIPSSNFTAVANLSAVKAGLMKNSEQRISNSLDFKYLKEDIAELKKRDKEVSVPLNEAKLKAEREAQEAKSLARQNDLRALRGLPAIKKGEKITKQDTFDFIEDESLKVMGDFMQQSGNYVMNLGGAAAPKL
ncbi:MULTISPECIES: carboxy terminal-processing peptidase [unclassified Pedobacter]|uniref:carboxy terminal-processing peptidase n=1 Tax=unclassified Pedobacter TaxID=2628915 RepID=UPI00209BD658|nr:MULTISPECIES: carboxy terminal-processing peptidase [unclassified Pedobacter]MCX2431801.1 carboxy terminal-processing peptidase [Pedobacter sp. GR22-10]